MIDLTDNFGRRHDYLRLSLSEKCNFNCIYCNPKNGEKKHYSSRNELSFEQLLRIIDIFAGKLGFRKFRFTGGEPLLRKNVRQFFSDVKKLKEKYGFETAVTTNGSLLGDNPEELYDLGIDRINFSLDTLDPEKFIRITGKNEFDTVLGTIEKLIEHGKSPIKINAVIIKGINDDELLSFAEYFHDKDVNIRFIEFMPFGNNDWQQQGFIPYTEMKKVIEEKFDLEPVPQQESSVAKDFALKGSPCRISFITSLSEHFCDSCNRARISADGVFKTCLFESPERSLNIKKLMESEFTDDMIIKLLQLAVMKKWEQHPDTEELKIMHSNNMLKIGG